jgi:host factor-I protein
MSEKGVRLNVWLRADLERIRCGRLCGQVKTSRGSAMESKTAQNVQDTYFNTVRKDKTPLTIYLVNGVRVHGRIRSFDKFSVLLENGEQEQLVFKHAISTVTTGAAGARPERRTPLAGLRPIANGIAMAPALSSAPGDGVEDASESAGAMKLRSPLK